MGLRSQPASPTSVMPACVSSEDGWTASSVDQESDGLDQVLSPAGSVTSPSTGSSRRRRKSSWSKVQFSFDGDGDLKAVPSCAHGKLRSRSEAANGSRIEAVPLVQKRGGMLQKRKPGSNLSIVCKWSSSAWQSTLQVGRSWEEQFDLLDTLGQGSTGTVRRGIRKADKLEVAVKIMQATDEEMISIRRQEFELLRRVQHPHIVKAFEFITCPTGLAVLVLEYFNCRTLRHAIQMSLDHRLSEATSKELCQMLFEAMECLHQHRIVHRDIKPCNILVSPDLTDLRVVDFNSSRCVLEGGSLTMTGTMQYLPPEVLLGDSPSEFGDVWSAGLCLHEMLAGCLPWQAVGRNFTLLGETILTTQLCIKDVPWQKTSDQCKGFLKTCLNIDWKLRQTPTALLQHSWLQGSQSSKLLRRGDLSMSSPSTPQLEAAGYLSPKRQAST
eukprot:TRINITY_DN51653_c0_g1_i1.p1 TRINITY_DN51653_c0_g1~~TRINITY_DN51653_c0_g1_i1.p1  ORF type:complete len:441 (+),score=60.36 TRINITY_DN51653_c0_g1_i1:42-1364(+)